MDLRHATQAVGVLNALRSGAVDQGAFLDQGSQVVRGGDLTLMAAHFLQERMERLGDAAKGFQGHGADNVGGQQQALGSDQGQSGQTGHQLRAVDQRQPFLSRQFDGLQSGQAEGLCCRHPLSCVPYFPFSQQGQSHVSEGGEVSAGPQGSLGRNMRVDSLV